MATFIWNADSERPFVFIHIPKTGGTSLTIGAACPNEEPPRGQQFFLLKPSGRFFSPEGLQLAPEFRVPSMPKIAPSSSYEKQLGMEEHLRARDLQWLKRSCVFATVVRNPWDRFASVYAAWASRQRSRMALYEMDDEAAGEIPDSLPEPGMMAYIDQIEGLLHAHDTFLGPQVDWVLDDDGWPVCTTVWRFERLSAAWEEMKSVLGLPGDRPLPHARKQSRKPYQQYYEEEPLAKIWVGDRYERDIEMFGYEFEGPR